jgi:uncharacterized metal-binding protein
MPELPKKKVGLIACSGEELPEGTVTRAAVRRVLETLRPDETVTLCLPLFLAGGEGERAFARHYPTIAVDGCEKRCAALATEKYSARPAASIVVSEVAAGTGGRDIGTARRLNEAGKRLADSVAELIAAKTDGLLKRPPRTSVRKAAPSCGCGCGLEPPSGELSILGKPVRVMGLPFIFAQFRNRGKEADEKTGTDILEEVKVYNEIPKIQEKVWREALLREYARFLKETR